LGGHAALRFTGLYQKRLFITNATNEQIARMIFKRNIRAIRLFVAFVIRYPVLFPTRLMRVAIVPPPHPSIVEAMLLHLRRIVNIAPIYNDGLLH